MKFTTEDIIEDVGFFKAIDKVAAVVYNEQVAMGFHDSQISQVLKNCGFLETSSVFKELDNLEDVKRLALAIGELNEAVEAIRKDIKVSEHLPEFTGVEEEVADCIIRLLDFAGQRNLRLGAAIKAKLEFNKTRGRKHGKLF